MSENFSFQTEWCLLSLLLRTHLKWIHKKEAIQTHTTNPVEFTIIIGLHILRLFAVFMCTVCFFRGAIVPFNRVSSTWVMFARGFYFAVAILFFFVHCLSLCRSLTIFSCYELRLLNWKDANDWILFVDNTHIQYIYLYMNSSLLAA